jgi:hypothetical protein
MDINRISKKWASLIFRVKLKEKFRPKHLERKQYLVKRPQSGLDTKIYWLTVSRKVILTLVLQCMTFSYTDTNSWNLSVTVEKYSEMWCSSKSNIEIWISQTIPFLQGVTQKHVTNSYKCSVISLWPWRKGYKISVNRFLHVYVVGRFIRTPFFNNKPIKFYIAIKYSVNIWMKENELRSA